MDRILLIRAYLSDVSPWWTMARQEAVLAAAAVPDWPSAVTYCDPLKARQRRAHQPASLSQRAAMLRPTARRDGGETIHVASLAVLAWVEDDFTTVLDALVARNATLVAVDDGLIVPPTSDAKLRDAVIVAWRAARTKSRLRGAAKRGAAVSAARRKAQSDAAIAKIKDRWPLPSRDWPTADLIAESGLSRNTIQARLGRRPIAQYRLQEKLRRRTARAKEMT